MIENRYNTANIALYYHIVRRTTKLKARFKRLMKRLRTRYRLVVLNEQTLEEQFSYKLTELRVYLALSTLVFISVLMVFLIIVFTPLKEYIPGYADVGVRNKIKMLQKSSDSLEIKQKALDMYLQGVQKILQDQVAVTNISPKSEIKAVSKNDIDTDMPVKEALKQDLMLNTTEPLVENKSQEKVFPLLSSPYKGFIVASFRKNTHPYITQKAVSDQPVKAIADGVVVAVIAKGSTTEIIIQHADKLMSIYRYFFSNSVKKAIFVPKGQTLGTIPANHQVDFEFELWYDGVPIDPQEYIIF